MIGSMVKETWYEVTLLEKLVLLGIGITLLLNRLAPHGWEYVIPVAGAELVLFCLILHSLFAGFRWRAAVLYLILAAILFISAILDVMTKTPMYGWHL